MANVLVVDDSPGVIKQVVHGLETRLAGIKVLTADDGQEAIEVLEAETINLLVTDLSMPVMDGFSLLAYVKRKQPNLPVVVVTSLGLPQIDNRLGAFGALPTLRKPIDLRVLTEEVTRSLTEAGRGYLHGVTLPGLLQLLGHERKSCSLLVTTSNDKGRLHFLSGALVNAYIFSTEQEGEAAALAILGWDEVDVEIERSYHNAQQLIDRPLEGLLLEAAQRKDEASEQVGPSSKSASALGDLAGATLQALETRLFSAGPQSGVETVPAAENVPFRGALLKMLDRVCQAEEALGELTEAVALVLEEEQRRQRAEAQSRTRQLQLERLRANTETLATQLLSALSDDEQPRVTWQGQASVAAAPTEETDESSVS